MKKVIIFAAAIALTLASCGNKTQANATDADSAAATENVDSASVEGAGGEAVDETALSDDSKATITQLGTQLQKAIAAKDGKATITTLANLQTIYKNLVAQGKLDEAKAYGASIKKLVSENAESIKNVANGNVTILQLIDGVKNLPTSAAKTAAAAAANKAVSDVKTAAENKVNSEVQKANDKATAAANAAKAKAETKVNEARQKANDAVNKAANKAIKDLLK